MQYQKQTREQYIRQECEQIDEDQAYRDMIDECNGPVCIGNFEFQASKIIEELDPIAFRCGRNDYMWAEIYTEIDGCYYDTAEAETAGEEWDEKEWQRERQEKQNNE
ncbi:hypothetical protein LCGC14_0873410 [marine sediment metagenome]|uniref:Uncharacterized protein n=1 Tax=marine sediment metagenome TaxID=412755 RepID=A0A0F9SB19_9ZZZZ